MVIMMKFLKNNRGDGSAIPILFILIVSLAAIMIIFIKQIDVNLINLQKARYTKAIEMAVNTALTTVELAPALNPDDESNLDVIALGYTLNNKMEVDKERLAEVFLQTLYRNVQAKNITQQEQFKQYVPLMAVVQYDTLWMTAYCDKTNWKDYSLGYYDSDNAVYVFLTLEDKYFTLTDNDPDSWNDETKREYHSIFPTDEIDNPFDLTEADRNQYLADAVANNLTGFVNGYKKSHKYYAVNIGAFDKGSFSNSVKDVTAFCFVEGIPIKTFLSNEPDRSFYSFKLGGASIKRADQ